VGELYSRYINVTIGIVLRCDWIIMKHDSVVVTIRIRIRIFIIPINGPTIGANRLHTLIIVIGGNYIYYICII